MSLREQLRSLQHRIMGTPFVYDYVRPLAVGGIDFSPLYDQIVDPDAEILDVGCGTGAAHKYLRSFKRYVGMDTDPIAVAHAQKRYGSANVSFHAQICTPEDVKRIAPTDVVLAGILHHLTDDEAKGLLASLRESPKLRQVLSVDIVFLPGRPVNNFLAGMDRGQYCRPEFEYHRLAEQSGLKLERSQVLRSHRYTGLAQYIYMTLRPQG
ncbi:MAG TPA: class I SAM-dependent methyltransferase [Polyangiaceae bacterium]|nr:class I SAM-dependent methyltransferase [Polyangiaceae bacterium]